MISIMLVAGEKTEKLAKFLQQKGTFDIECSYNSLSEEINTIKDNIINVDKLVYLLDNQVLNIRTEMQLLKDLLTVEGFFTTREIIFIVTNNVDVDKALRYFKTVMLESDFNNYSINRTNDKVSFADIFDYIIGTTNSDNFRNTFKEVYRVERNSESAVAYTPADDSNLVIEPFNYERVNLYETAKENSRRAESGILHHDAFLEDSNVIKADNINLGDLQVIDSIRKIETLIITGERKTGISTWATALAASAVSAGHSVTLIDFTDNYDIEELLKSNGLTYQYVRMIDMLHNYKYEQNAINLVSTFTEKEKDIRTEFLQHVYTNRNSIAPICIIAIPEYLYESVQHILVNEISRVLYCINPIYNDILAKQEVIYKFAQKENFMVVLNNRIRLLQGVSAIDKETLEGLLPFNMQIIQAIDFDNLNVDAGLFNSLMEI